MCTAHIYLSSCHLFFIAHCAVITEKERVGREIEIDRERERDSDSGKSDRDRERERERENE